MRRRGFTLVEALVVVSIIALLIGILVPTLSGARDAARTAACLSNLRSLGVAQALYARDRDGALVDVGLAHGGFAHGHGSWLESLAPYVEHADAVRRCAADRSAHWPVEEGGDGLALPGMDPNAPPILRQTSYCVNNFLTTALPAQMSEASEAARTSMDRLKDHSRTAQFLELVERGDFAVSDHPHIENWHVPGLEDYSARLAANECETNRHGKKKDFGAWNARANYGFLDAHAATLEFREVYTDATKNSFDPGVMR